MKKTLAILALLASASPAAAGFWVVGQPYALYYNANVRLAAQVFGRIIEVDEPNSYVLMDHCTSKTVFQNPQDFLLDGNEKPPLHYPPTKVIWWSLKDVVYAARLDKLPQ